MIAVGQKEVPPTPIVGVGATIRGVNPIPPPNVGVTDGAGATIRGVNPIPPPNVGVTDGAGATMRGVNPIPPNVGLRVGVNDGAIVGIVGVSMKEGKAAAVVGTMGTEGNIRAVGHNPIPPPMTPGATVGTGATMRGVKPPTPIVGIRVGVGGTIRVVGVIPGAVAIGRIMALTLDEIRPKTVIMTSVVSCLKCCIEYFKSATGL